MSDLRETLNKDVANISWTDILPHAKRDAVIVVKPELDLLEVAEAIARDNTSSVQEWIAARSIAKPTAEQLTKWNDNPQKQFTASIVQPFVVVKEAKNS